MQAVGDGLVARLRLTAEGVQVGRREVKFFKNLDQLLSEAEVVQ